jgi:hypothetical protein
MLYLSLNTMKKIDNEALHYLNVVKNARPKLRRALLKHSDKDQIDALAQCCLNFLRQTFKVTSPELAKLRRHRASIRAIADNRVARDKKRKIFVQRGAGFLPFILPAAISLLSTILSK